MAIIAGNNARFRVVDVAPFEEEDESPFVGLPQVGPGLVADVEDDPAGSHAENERHTDMDVTARGAVD
jgi:hypothetical protein